MINNHTLLRMSFLWHLFTSYNHCGKPRETPGFLYLTLLFIIVPKAQGQKEWEDGAWCFLEKWLGSPVKIRFQGLLPKLISTVRENLVLWWGLKRTKYFFNWHIFYYYIHIKMMSNMPYQMVYSNCQNKGWSVSNFPKNLLGNSSSEKWQEPAMSSSTTQASLKILGEQRKFLPE